jgi:hypothetical protein
MGFSSLALMTVVNANYEYLYCGIGSNCRVSDGRVFEYTKFYEKLLRDELNRHLPRKPDNSTSNLPFVFLGDEDLAFQSKTAY